MYLDKACGGLSAFFGTLAGAWAVVRVIVQGPDATDVLSNSSAALFNTTDVAAAAGRAGAAMIVRYAFVEEPAVTVPLLLVILAFSLCILSSAVHRLPDSRGGWCLLVTFVAVAAVLVVLLVSGTVASLAAAWLPPPAV